MNYAIKDACDVYLLNRTTQKPVLFSDYANSTNLGFSSDSTFARAKGVNKIGFDGGKEGNFTINFEVFDLAWLSILLGAVESKEKIKELKREVLTVNDELKVELAEIPEDGSLAIFTVERDKRTHIEEQEITTDYSVTDKSITFTTLTKDTDVVVYYLLETEKAVRKFVINATDFSENFTLIGKTQIKNEFGEFEFMNLELPNIKPSSEMEITMDADGVTNIAAQFDIFPNENNQMAVISIIN